MNTIEEEIKALVTFLSHPAGFNVDYGGIMCIRPIDENSPPKNWEVGWTESDEELEYEYHKEFSSLDEAAQCFVEKRRYLCYGLDFEKMVLEEDKDD